METIKHVGTFEGFAAISYIGDMIPTGGRGTPIAPPTYIKSDSEKLAAFATAEDHPVPDPEQNYREYLKDENGARVLRPAAIVNSLGAEAERIERAIVQNSSKLGIELPGIFLKADNYSDADLEAICEEVIKQFTKGSKKQTQYTPKTLAQALRNDFETAQASNWTAAHRHVDSYIRHAEIDGKQIWANPESEVYQIISGASAQKAELLFRYFPASALFGFWLSSVAQRRHKWARALSSTIIGYDAHPVSYGATKNDVLGGVSSEIGLKRDPHTLEIVAGAGKEAKPSAVGLGMVPNSPTPKVFSCESILRRSSISLTHLRHLKVSKSEIAEGSPNASEQMTDVLAWLGIFGILAASRHGFLRSSCDLVTGKAKSGFQLIDFDGESVDFEIDLEGAAEGFRQAYAALPESLKFAEPIDAQYPEIIVKTRAQTLLIESNSAKSEKEE